MKYKEVIDDIYNSFDSNLVLDLHLELHNGISSELNDDIDLKLIDEPYWQLRWELCDETRKSGNITV